MEEGYIYVLKKDVREILYDKKGEPCGETVGFRCIDRIDRIKFYEDRPLLNLEMANDILSGCFKWEHHLDDFLTDHITYFDYYNFAKLYYGDEKLTGYSKSGNKYSLVVNYYEEIIRHMNRKKEIENLLE